MAELSIGFRHPHRFHQAVPQLGGVSAGVRQPHWWSACHIVSHSDIFLLYASHRKRRSREANAKRQQKRVCRRKMRRAMARGQAKLRLVTEENFRLKREIRNMDALIRNVAPGLSGVPVYILDDLEDINRQVQYPKDTILTVVRELNARRARLRRLTSCNGKPHLRTHRTRQRGGNAWPIVECTSCPTTALRFAIYPVCQKAIVHRARNLSVLNKTRHMFPDLPRGSIAVTGKAWGLGMRRAYSSIISEYVVKGTQRKGKDKHFIHA